MLDIVIAIKSPSSRSYKWSDDSMSELFSQVTSRSIIDFIKETGFYRKI